MFTILNVDVQDIIASGNSLVRYPFTQNIENERGLVSLTKFCVNHLESISKSGK